MFIFLTFFLFVVNRIYYKIMIFDVFRIFQQYFSQSVTLSVTLMEETRGLTRPSGIWKGTDQEFRPLEGNQITNLDFRLLEVIKVLSTTHRSLIETRILSIVGPQAFGRKQGFQAFGSKQGQLLGFYVLGRNMGPDQDHRHLKETRVWTRNSGLWKKQGYRLGPKATGRNKGTDQDLGYLAGTRILNITSDLWKKLGY